MSEKVVKKRRWNVWLNCDAVGGGIWPIMVRRGARHDFTQRQLMACLILRRIEDDLPWCVGCCPSADLRKRWNAGQAAAHTTLQKFSARSAVLAIAMR